MKAQERPKDADDSELSYNDSLLNTMLSIVAELIWKNSQSSSAKMKIELGSVFLFPVSHKGSTSNATIFRVVLRICVQQFEHIRMYDYIERIWWNVMPMIARRI